MSRYLLCSEVSHGLLQVLPKLNVLTKHNYVQYRTRTFAIQCKTFLKNVGLLYVSDPYTKIIGKVPVGHKFYFNIKSSTRLRCDIQLACYKHQRIHFKIATLTYHTVADPGICGPGGRLPHYYGFAININRQCTGTQGLFLSLIHI